MSMQERDNLLLSQSLGLAFLKDNLDIVLLLELDQAFLYPFHLFEFDCVLLLVKICFDVEHPDLGQHHEATLHHKV